MSSQPPTLMDAVFRASYQKELQLGWRSNAAMRAALTSARRFVLDDEMSSFLGDLATASFANTSKIKITLADQLRRSARLPFKTTWVEYNLRRELARSNEIIGRKFNEAETPNLEGWLLEQHPAIETAFRVHIFSHAPEEPGGYKAYAFPVAYAWTVDDATVLPWRPSIRASDKGLTISEAATGVIGYKTDAVGIVESNLIITPKDLKPVHELVTEWIGVMRRIWALLATLNDVPTTIDQVVPSRGFIGRGLYRKYLEHRTITLRVPQKIDKYKLARKIVAFSRRKGGPVRGHYRKDWRQPPHALCEHEWQDNEVCRICNGKRMWIRDHERGDAGLGYVTHDYIVEHERS